MKKLFLDMDGVLTDFQRAILKLHGERGAKLAYTDIIWNFFEQLGMTAKECFSVCDQQFWATLPWTPEGENLLRNLERIVPRKQIVLLSSLALGGSDGKTTWIKTHLPEYAESNYLLGVAKWACADANTALIDDSDVNCMEFAKFGGTPILVPRPWNMLKAQSPQGTYKMRPLLDQVRRWWEK